MKFRSLETDRLMIRRVRPQDRFDLFEIFSDEQSCNDSGGYEPFLAMDDEYQLLMDRLINDSGRFVLERKSDQKVIGTIHLKKADKPGVEIGYIISPRFRREGYAYEALSAAIDYCFADGVKTIHAGVFSYNTPSMELLSKLGFVYDCTIYHSHRHCKYGYADMMLFKLEKPKRTFFSRFGCRFCR